jgi:hypothetical protein
MDRPSLRLDWEVVLAGAALAAAVDVPVIVLGTTLSSSSSLVIPLYFVLLAGQVAAGAYAARHHLEAPLVHGALAPLVAYLVIVIVVVVVRAIDGRAPDATALIFDGFMAASAGIFGALFATRTHARRHRPAPVDDPPPSE